MVKQIESNNSKLHFAALIRVSTEQQEKTGESLRTQKTEIENAVKQLNGDIVSWYGGQEHATPGFGKKEIDRLLSDAQKKAKLFDAVIVTNADRWSRDNQKSTEGLAVFREQEIKFFIGTSEQDLFSPDHCLILGMFAEFGQFFASNQKRKSLLSRIHRAKRGLLTCGKRPYGRIFDKENGWSIDKEKQDIIQMIAKRYLAGEKLSALAEEFNMNHSNLHKILTKRCGNMWEQEFRDDGLKIHEKTTVTIPPLLPDNIIAAILKKAEANKTYHHGQKKYSYLLSRMIFCKHCGYTMFGQRNNNGHQYYRHAHTKRIKKCNQSKGWIRADELEGLVMLYLFDCFGNPLAVQKAIEQAMPNLEKIQESQNRLERIETELEKIEKGREKIIRFIAKGVITENQAEKQLEALKQNENNLQLEQGRLCDSLENKPSSKAIKEMSKKFSTQFRSHHLRINTIKWAAKEVASLNKMTYEDKRALVEMVFSGKTAEGKRMGVYIEWNKQGWKFDIHGHLIDEKGLMLMSESRKKAVFDFDKSGFGWKQKELVTKSACN